LPGYKSSNEKIYSILSKKILVTGGAGYIGSKFCYDAIDNGYEIIVVDNLSTGKKKLLPPNVIFYKCNISNTNKINSIFIKHKIKNVVHFAASISVEESMRNPVKHYINNTIATEKLIKVCVKNKIDKFIFSSTCAVYGNINKKIISEKLDCYPESHYGKSKLLSEILLKNYSKKFKFSLGVLRYFNVIGADKKLRTGCVNNIGQLFKNLAKNIDKNFFHINVFGNNYDTPDGSCIRDYIDINDLSIYHLELLKKLKKKEIVTLNCGYGKGYSVFKIINQFEKFLKIKLKIKILKKREGDLDKIICHTGKLKRYFNLNLRTTITESIKNTLKWEKKWSKLESKRS